MKTFCALATLSAATAATSAAPQISLNLNGAAVVDECTGTGDYRDGTCGKYPAHAASSGHTTYDSSHPNSFAAKCLVGTNTAASCPEPEASAYDHHDSTATVKKTYNYFVISRAACKDYSEAISAVTTPAQALDTGNQLGLTAATCVKMQDARDVELQSGFTGATGFTAAYRALRGEFIIKYDAEDRAGNEASQLIFAMIMVDDSPPTVTRPAEATLQACDMSRDATFAVTAQHRNEISIDERQIYNTDNFDGVSPQMSHATAAVRAHGLHYTLTHTAGAVVNSDTTGMVQALHDSYAMNGANQAGAAKVVYTAKDYADIFGKSYADNVETYTDSAWIIKDDIAPRPVHNFAQGQPVIPAAGETMVTSGQACGEKIAVTGTAKDACQCFNYRRKWGTKQNDGSNLGDEQEKCVGYTAGHIYTNVASYASYGLTCHSVSLINEASFHECGTNYYEPGHKCIDMRDSFVQTAGASVVLDYNDAQGPFKYHVDKQVDAMHAAITYSQGAPQGLPGSRDGVTLSTGNEPTGYPIYTHNAVITATYTCTDRAGNTASNTRTTTVRDTVAPTLEITTMGMQKINVQTGVGYTATHSLDDVHSALCSQKTPEKPCQTNDELSIPLCYAKVGGECPAGTNDSGHFEDVTGAGPWEPKKHGTMLKQMNSHFHVEGGDPDYAIGAGTTAGPNPYPIEGAGTTAVAAMNRGGKEWQGDPGLADAKHTLDSYIIQHSSGFDSDEQVIEALVDVHDGYACFDNCDGDLTHPHPAGDHVNPQNDDHSGPVNGVKMHWHKLPVGSAANADPCLDQYATSDGFHTLIPGTYALKYTCHDDAGHVTSKCRTIQNEDHTKPVITVLEADLQTYEATRQDNYVDAGATCSDEVDGNISQDVEVSGDVVNLARVGVYTIKYNCQDSASNLADTATRTVVVQDTSCPSCVLSADTTDAAVDATVSIEASFPYNDVGAVATDSLQGSFGICSVWSNGEMKTSYKNIVNVERTGVYEITYRVKDSNGNWNDGTSCSGGQTGSENVRTVTIVDTLRPVIELKYNSQVIHQSAKEFTLPAENAKTHLAKVGLTHGHTGAIHSSAGNPAGSFMAEEASTSSVNGWVVGAVASAVSGLALLGYSLRKSAPVATSVPV